MMKISLLTHLGSYKVQIAILFFVFLLVFVALNLQQLYFAWAIRSETMRLTKLGKNTSGEFQNPPPVEEHFGEKLSPDFWNFTVINGGGKVSNEMAWHSAEIVFAPSLTIQHFPDPAFESEGSKWHVPAADRYNNVSLIGGSGFCPSASSDVVLKFTMRVSEGFYGSAGVIVQPVGTLRKDGAFVKPFDMFGVTVTGKESSVMGITGPVCYLALQQFPVRAESVQVDTQSLHTYEIRLHWVDQTEWLGNLIVDGTKQCQIWMPPFGPVEVHVWSDNALALYRPRLWWEIGPTLGLKYQDGGNKQFQVGMIQIFEERR